LRVDDSRRLPAPLPITSSYRDKSSTKAASTNRSTYPPSRRFAATKPSSDGLLTLSEAAEALGYKPSGLRKLAKAGVIRYVQNGTGPIKFRREWLDEFIAANNPTQVKRAPARRRSTPPTTGFPGFDATFYADSQSGSE